MKKTLAIALSLSMAAGLMTGCGSKPAETNATTAAPKAAETGKSEAAETTEAQNTAEKEPAATRTTGTYRWKNSSWKSIHGLH